MTDWEPIEGVTLEQYVEITAAALRHGLTRADAIDRLAATYGVAVGRWAAVQRGWLERFRRDPEARARYGTLYLAASRR